MQQTAAMRPSQKFQLLQYKGAAALQQRVGGAQLAAAEQGVAVTSGLASGVIERHVHVALDGLPRFRI